MVARDDEERRAWLRRRVGFGATAAEREAHAALSVDALADALLAPASVPDPWADVDLAGFDPTLAAKDKRAYTTRTIGAWLASMATTPAPFGEWLRWFWHGHFVSTLRVVKWPQLLVGQLGLFGPDRLGLGRFDELLRAVTVDPAMLVYLDGTTNRRGAVNENYGREVLELFALGIGNYTEADVRAGAEALTGWRADRRGGGPAVFDARRHDDAPKAYLGTTVHDVDTVVAAIAAHPACAPFVTRQLVDAILGPDVEGAVVQRLAEDFAASGLALRPLVRAIVDAGLDGAGGSFVLAPVPWLAAMLRATGAPTDQVLASVGPRGLVAAGQVPMDAPNVAGWPDRRAWLSSSATVARVNLAAGIAALVPADAPVRECARRGDLDALARAFDRPGGFSPATAAALRDLGAGDRTGDAVLTVAMASPELVTA